MNLAMPRVSAPVSNARPRAMAGGRRPLPRVRATAKELEARWESQLLEGKVVNVKGSEAADLMKQGWTLLDVRPPSEANKVPVMGAVQVPLFLEDPDMSPAGLLKKWAHFGTGGWWLGGTHMIPNENFITQVQQAVPSPNAKIIVACQKGLRSLASCEQLSRLGYKNIAWVNGGMDACKTELPTPGGRDLRHAGTGGFSEILGWTEVDESEGNAKLGGTQGVIGFFVLILAADIALWGWNNVQYWQSGGEGFLPLI